MFRNARFAIATNFLLTGLRMLFYGFVLVLLMESVRVEVELCPMIVLNAVSQFSTMIPITIYGIGIMESIWVAGFHRLNIAADSVIAAAIIGRTLVLISSILLWIIILLKKR